MADDHVPSIEELARRIDAVKRQAAHEVTEADSGRLDRFSPATRLGVELLAGVIAGIAVGYFIDNWRDTSPWFTVGFFFLGCLAGLRNIKRLSEPLDKE